MKKTTFYNTYVRVVQVYPKRGRKGLPMYTYACTYLFTKPASSKGKVVYKTGNEMESNFRV